MVLLRAFIVPTTIGADVIGLLAFSYGLTAYEPFRCNAMLADETIRIRDNEDDEVAVAAQWEIALGIHRFDPSGPGCNLVIGPYLDRYLGSADVIREAKENLFDPRGIRAVIPVAQTFLHYRSVCTQLETAGFTVIQRPIQHIGHNPRSLQTHTRGPIRLAAYAARQKLWAHEGERIVTDQMRSIDKMGFDAYCKVRYPAPNS